MSLVQRQHAFRAEIIAEDDGAAPSSVGMEIYRDAYRGRLLGVLEASFERVRRWVGPTSFTAAACHYILTRPPRGWTLDDYGANFPALLESLFADDREVAELAWLEWRMQQAFAAIDAPTLDPAALAAVGYSEAEWDRLGFVMGPGFAARPITTNCVELWDALDGKSVEGFEVVHSAEAQLIVWRSGLTPRFRVMGTPEYRALSSLAEGGSLGDLTENAEADRLGGWLAGWLGEGLFASAVLRG